MQSCSNGVQDETLIWDLCYDPRQCSDVWSVQKKPALSCEVEHWATVVSWSTHCCRTLRSCCVTRVHMRTEQGSLVGGVRVEVQSSQMCVMSANAAGFLWFLKKKRHIKKKEVKATNTIFDSRLNVASWERRMNVNVRQSLSRAHCCHCSTAATVYSPVAVT